MGSLLTTNRSVLGISALLSTALAGGTLASAAQAFETGGSKWPGNPAKIRYYDKTDGEDGWAVKRAISAWNDSGPDLRFKDVPKSEARLIIRYFPDSDRRTDCLLSGTGTLGYPGAFPARVHLTPSKTDRCKFAQAHIAAHELGHVVGLHHEEDRCAAMNSVAVFFYPTYPQGAAPYECSPAAEGAWRCRLLERDDVRGAERRYGGSVEDPPAAFCPLPSASSAGEARAAPGDGEQVRIDLSGDVRRPGP